MSKPLHIADAQLTDERKAKVSLTTDRKGTRQVEVRALKLLTKTSGVYSCTAEGLTLPAESLPGLIVALQLAAKVAEGPAVLAPGTWGAGPYGKAAAE